MAGIDLAPQSKSQLAAVARVRWQVLSHSIRTTRGVLELVSRVLIGIALSAGGFGGALLLGLAAWYFTSNAKPELLAVVLWPVFLFWQLFPVMATAFTETLDSSELLRFPMNYRSFALVRLLYGALEPATLLCGFWLTGMAIGIGVAQPGLFLWSALLLLIFALLNMMLTQMVFAWVERWLAQRRTREIFAVLFFLTMISFQLIGPLMNRFGPRSNPAFVLFGERLTPIQRVLPPGVVAYAIASLATGRILLAMGSLLLLVLYGVVILRVLSIRLQAQYRGENLSEVAKDGIARKDRQTVREGWAVPGVSAPVAAVLEKEFRYLSRSGPMLLTLITPIIMMVVFGVGSGRPGGGILQGSPDFRFPAVAAYTLLLLTNLVYNNFGADGGGIQFFLFSPVSFRQILLGKNLAHIAVLLLELLVVWVGVSLLFRRPTLVVTLATLAGILFAAPINLAIGNLLSLYSPKKVEFGTFGRQRASQLTVLVSFGVQIFVLGIGAATFAVARHYADMWVAVAIFLVLALITVGGYVFALRRTDRIAFTRREVLTGELCKA